MCFEWIFTKIIFIKRVATPEGPKSENRNQLELKTASLSGMETDGSPWKLTLAAMHSTQTKDINIQFSQNLMQPSVNQP